MVRLFDTVSPNATHQPTVFHGTFDPSSPARHLQHNFTGTTDGLLSLQTDTKKLFDRRTRRVFMLDFL
jgi:hypothetical protein